MVDEASDQELDEVEEELYVQMLFTQEQVQKLRFHMEMVQAWLGLLQNSCKRW
jgi:hypothetical protein